jgi:hypothetical protein
MMTLGKKISGTRTGGTANIMLVCNWKVPGGHLKGIIAYERLRVAISLLDASEIGIVTNCLEY